MCGIGVFRTRRWLSPVGADCVRAAPRTGEIMPANLSDFIICRAEAGKSLNICLSGLHLVRRCLQFSSSAGCLHNPSKNNISRKHAIGNPVNGFWCIVSIQHGF